MNHMQTISWCKCVKGSMTKRWNVKVSLKFDIQIDCNTDIFFKNRLPVSNDSKIVTVLEILRWKEKWKKQDIAVIPTNAIDALQAFNAHLFPIVRKLLNILATLPVTNATSESSFSTMRRLKMYLRSTMGKERLTGFALLWIQLERSIDKNGVLNEHVTSSNRISDLLFSLTIFCVQSKSLRGNCPLRPLASETRETIPTFEN